MQNQGNVTNFQVERKSTDANPIVTQAGIIEDFKSSCYNYVYRNGKYFSDQFKKITLRREIKTKTRTK